MWNYARRDLGFFFLCSCCVSLSFPRQTGSPGFQFFPGYGLREIRHGFTPALLRGGRGRAHNGESSSCLWPPAM